MIISKARALTSSQGERCVSGGFSGKRRPSSGVPDLQHLLENRDYTGAITLLQFKHLENVCDPTTLEWLAYCHFHHGEHDKSLNFYKQLLAEPNSNPMYHIYAAACLYYMAMYNEAETEALKGPACSLQMRILFHVANKKKDEKSAMEYVEKLTENAEDQLSLAAYHYFQASYEDATDIYKKILLEHRDWLALNVYVALCYYNLDFHDVSLEILNGYLQTHPDSTVGANLKACNKYKLWGGKTAAADSRISKGAQKGAIENELMQHNIVVFNQGEGAVQVLPHLMDIFPEARLNLAAYHLNHNELRQAFEVVKKLEPSTPQEYVVKAVTCASLGQEVSSEDLIHQARELFQSVGSSASECDTIQGRQSMASYFFLNKQFEDALVYLKSIKNFCEDIEEFKWNYGIAKAAVGDYAEAEEVLSLICSEKLVEDYYYHAWFSYCLIMNGKGQIAWERYLQFDLSDESLSLLQLIANECYRTGQYFYAAKAFSVLTQSDDTQEYWEGLRGACIGVMEKIVNRKEADNNQLREVLILLSSSSNPEAELIVNSITKWVKDSGLVCVPIGIL